MAKEKVKTMSKAKTRELKFVIKGKDFYSEGILTEDGFKVFKGSTVAPISETFKKQKSYYDCRAKCESECVILDGKFTTDHTFKSAALATSVICGRLANVNNQLRTSDGIKFGDCYPKLPGKKREFVGWERYDELLAQLSEKVENAKAKKSPLPTAE